METELVNAAGEVYLKLAIDEENQWVQASWHGSCCEEFHKSGLEAHTDTLGQTDYSALLIDTRGFENGWQHSLDWILEVWAPRAINAGLRYYALVGTPDTFSAATADAFYTHVHGFEAEAFSDLATARAWLRRTRILNEAPSLQAS